jgi:hypothetical protein
MLQAMLQKLGLAKPAPKYDHRPLEQVMNAMIRKNLQK